IDSTPHSRHMLPNVEVDPLHKGSIHLPAPLGQHLIDRLQCAENHPVTYPHQTTAAHGLDDLAIEELWQWPPALLGSRPFALAAWGLEPVSEMGEDRG